MKHPPTVLSRFFFFNLVLKVCWRWLVFILSLRACAQFWALEAWFGPHMSAEIISGWVMKASPGRALPAHQCRRCSSDPLWYFLHWVFCKWQGSWGVWGIELEVPLLCYETKFGKLRPHQLSHGWVHFVLPGLHFQLSLPSAQLSTVACFLALWWWRAHFRTPWVLL